MSGTDVDRRVHEMLISILELGTLMIGVLLAALGVMSWEHQGTALTGIVIGLVLMIGSLCLVCWRLGRLG